MTALQPPQFLGFRLPPAGPRAYAALTNAADPPRAANASAVLQNVYTEGLPQAPQINLVIEQEKARAFGVSFEDINNISSTNLGPTDVNDFPNRGRMTGFNYDPAIRISGEALLGYTFRDAIAKNGAADRQAATRLWL